MIAAPMAREIMVVIALATMVVTITIVMFVGMASLAAMGALASVKPQLRHWSLR